MRDKTYSGEEDRQRAHSVSAVEHLPFGGFNLKDDTVVSFSYEDASYGGSLSMDYLDNALDINDWIKIKAWVRLGPHFKITAGNDIGAEYADSLDADPGMRIYTGAATAASPWDESKNPDNITQDKGVLFESLIGPLTLAFAGQYYDGSTESLAVDGSKNKYSVWEDVDQKSYGYGARAGWAFGSWGKVNVSYINQYRNTASNYRIDPSTKKPVPSIPNAEVDTRMFGAYASMRVPPVPGLAFTLGYNGILTRYFDEFYRALGGTGMTETLVPSVYQQGVNVNLRYKGIPRLTLRTDNNYSFWTDRDYSPFGIPQRGNYGLGSSVEGDAYSNVDHRLLWNGIGAAYEFTGSFKLSLYCRRLCRRDTALQSDGVEWEVSWEKLAGELTAAFKPFGEGVELHAGITVEHETRFSSKEVNAQITSKFVSADRAADTTDTELVLKIPVGMTIKLQ
jgi:hypothetical protein